MLVAARGGQGAGLVARVAGGREEGRGGAAHDARLIRGQGQAGGGVGLFEKFHAALSDVAQLLQ